MARRTRGSVPHPALQPIRPAYEVRAGLVTAAAILAVGLLALNQALVRVFYDDGLYAGLATAVATGHGYVHPNLPAMPAGVHFPPFYPVVLAPVFGLLPVAAAALAAKILNALFAAAAAGLIAWHALRSEMLGPGRRLLSARAARTGSRVGRRP